MFESTMDKSFSSGECSIDRVWTMASGAEGIVEVSCTGPGVGFAGLDESLSTQHDSRFLLEPGRSDRVQRIQNTPFAKQ